MFLNSSKNDSNLVFKVVCVFIRLKEKLEIIEERFDG